MIIPIPENWQRRYRILRSLLYVGIIAAAAMFTLRVLFPTIPFSFNFKTPGSSRNNLLDPRSEESAPRLNGKIEADGTLVANASAIGDFSRARADVTLESKSEIPETLSFSIRRSYRGFLLPTGPAIAGFPEGTLYRADNAYYALRDGTLYPFVSESAYLSRYPQDFAQDTTEETLKTYPVAQALLGYRVGSLVSFADGVFVIVSDTEMRPIGSADIFLALGYDFGDVLPASEEEIGIYKRGRIFLLGATHPDGTLLLDKDSDTYYLVDQGFKRPIADQAYLDFLLGKQTPIVVSSIESEKQARCDLEPSFFGRTFSCAAPIDSLTPGYGNDYEIRIGQPDTDIDINMLTLSLETDKSGENMLALLSQIKQRLLSRFGLGIE